MFGKSKADELKTRILYLENLLCCITQLESEIRFTQTPIKDALKTVYKGASYVNKEIIKYVLNEMEKKCDTPVSEIWKDAVISNSDIIFCEDKELYLLIGNSVGNSDLESQIKNINLISLKISEAIKKATYRYEKNYKLYKNFGLYTGLLISVILL